MKETTSKDQCDVENNQGGLGKHVCSPYHLFVKVFTFLHGTITTNQTDENEGDREENELGLHIHDEPPKKSCCSLNVCLPLPAVQIQTDKSDWIDNEKLSIHRPNLIIFNIL